MKRSAYAALSVWLFEVRSLDVLQRLANHATTCHL